MSQIIPVADSKTETPFCYFKFKPYLLPVDIFWSLVIVLISHFSVLRHKRCYKIVGDNERI